MKFDKACDLRLAAIRNSLACKGRGKPKVCNNRGTRTSIGRRTCTGTDIDETKTGQGNSYGVWVHTN